MQVPNPAWMENRPKSDRERKKEKLKVLDLSRWMAKVGIRMIGRSTFTSSCTTPTPFLLTSTRPATLRSLSNQVCHNPLPYVCTPTFRKPALDAADTGLSLGQGLSVCAATTWKPFPALYLLHITNIYSNHITVCTTERNVLDWPLHVS